VIGIAVTFLIHLVAVGQTVSLRPVIDPPYWRALFFGSLAIGLAIGLSQIYFRIDTLLLALLRSSEEVGLYGAAYKFIELAQVGAAAVSVSLFPPLAGFVAARDPRARQLVQKAFDILLAGGIFGTVAMLVFPSEIIRFTAGSDYRDAVPALQLLAPYALLAAVIAALWPVLLASERDRALLATSLGVLVLNVALNVALIPSYGYKAAAVVSVVSEAAVLVPIALAVRREALLPDLGYAPQVALAGTVMAAGAWLVPGPTVLAAAVASAAYAAILLVAPGTVNEVARSLVPALGRGR
jgi:O-antigen/teichoic acid export membrane protein